MHNFFVSLVNTIGVPIIQVGTHRASKFFQRTFRAARRVSGLGSIRWDKVASGRALEASVEAALEVSVAAKCGAAG